MWCLQQSTEHQYATCAPPSATEACGKHPSDVRFGAHRAIGRSAYLHLGPTPTARIEHEQAAAQGLMPAGLGPQFADDLEPLAPLHGAQHTDDQANMPMVAHSASGAT